MFFDFKHLKPEISIAIKTQIFGTLKCRMSPPRCDLQYLLQNRCPENNDENETIIGIHKYSAVKSLRRIAKDEYLRVKIRFSRHTWFFHFRIPKTADGSNYIGVNTLVSGGRAQSTTIVVTLSSERTCSVRVLRRSDVNDIRSPLDVRLSLGTDDIGR